MLPSHCGYKNPVLVLVAVLLLTIWFRVRARVSDEVLFGAWVRDGVIFGARVRAGVIFGARV